MRSLMNKKFIALASSMGLATMGYAVKEGLAGFEPALIGVFVAVGVAIFFLRKFKKKREQGRTDELSPVAETLGFQFDDVERSSDIIPDRKNFHLFSRRGSVVNRMYGHPDHSNMIFGYRYSQSSGQNSRRDVYQTMVYFESEQPLPSFKLRPEHVFYRIGNVFGYRDIDFDSHPAFSKSYLLKGKDEEAVCGIFRDNVLDYIERNGGLSVECNGTHMIVYRSEERKKADEIAGFCEECSEVHDLFRLL